MANGEKKTVTHPADGVYMPKFLAGVLTAVLTAALLGGFANLWKLNTQAVAFDSFRASVMDGTVILPNTLSEKDWSYEKDLLMREIQLMNGKLDEMSRELKELTDEEHLEASRSAR